MQANEVTRPYCVHMCKAANAALLLLTAFCLSGCEDVSVSNAKKAIEAQLVDPGSVQYRDITTYNGGLVCGAVNSKNRMGGYVGFTNFVYSDRASELRLNVSSSMASLECMDVDAFALKHHEDLCANTASGLSELSCKLAEDARTRLK